MMVPIDVNTAPSFQENCVLWNWVGRGPFRAGIIPLKAQNLSVRVEPIQRKLFREAHITSTIISYIICYTS